MTAWSSVLRKELRQAKCAANPESAWALHGAGSKRELWKLSKAGDVGKAEELIRKESAEILCTF